MRAGAARPLPLAIPLSLEPTDQIPVTDGRGEITPWAAHWLEFVGAVFACWQEGKTESETLWACPELGALDSGYWIAPFPDPWQDAQRARVEFDRLWQKAG